jgi:hypothetical protein
MVNSPLHHPLKIWLHDHRRPNGFAAKRLGVSVITVSRWFMGVREMRVENRIAVEALTDGAVTRRAIEDWQAAHLTRLNKPGPDGLCAEPPP